MRGFVNPGIRTFPGNTRVTVCAKVPQCDRSGYRAEVVKQMQQTITVGLIGDSQSRDYPVTYEGTADFPRWERADGTLVGVIPVALVQEQDHEVLIAQHPDYGWCSTHTELCRDFDPPLDEVRLQQAR